MNIFRSALGALAVLALTASAHAAPAEQPSHQTIVNKIQDIEKPETYHVTILENNASSWTDTKIDTSKVTPEDLQKSADGWKLVAVGDLNGDYSELSSSESFQHVFKTGPDNRQNIEKVLDGNGVNVHLHEGVISVDVRRISFSKEDVSHEWPKNDDYRIFTKISGNHTVNVSGTHARGLVIFIDKK